MTGCAKVSHSLFYRNSKLTHYRKLGPLLLLPLLVSPAAQQMDTANGPNSVRTVSIFDEIQDAQERSLFKELWNTDDPQKGRQRAMDSVERYPRSVVLREAYEQAARASAVLGDDTGAIDFGKRALRLLPENPLLLTMVADLAARHGQHQLAETSGRQALRYLERALAPAAISPDAWPQVRDGLRNLADFALGRTAEEEGHYADAERWLLDALRIKPNDYVALYALGVERYARKDPDSAAPCFAEVMNTAGGALSEAARRELRQVYAAKTRSQTFEEFAASEHWSVPPAPIQRASPPAAYAGSAACRQCHAAEFRNWQATGMAKMFRPYSAGDVMGRFSGEEVLGDSVRTSAENGQRFIELREGDSGEWRRYRVDALIGSKWQQAYASQLPDGRLVVLPIQYSKVEGGWVNYWKIVEGSSERSDIAHFQGTPEGALYQRDCAPCHTSQLRYNGTAESPAAAQFREGGIDCEMCHGPSQAHVDAMRAGGFPQDSPRAVGRHLRAVPHAIAGSRTGDRRRSELFADRPPPFIAPTVCICYRITATRCFMVTAASARRLSSAKPSNDRAASGKAEPPACRATIPTRTMRRGTRNPSSSRAIPMRCAYSATERCAIVPRGIPGTRRGPKPATAFRATCLAIWMRCCSAPARTKSTRFPMPK